MGNCIQSALSTMSKEGLRALNDIMVTAKTSLGILKAEKQALLASLTIQTSQLQTAKSALDAVVGSVRSTVEIIPSTVVALCPEVGSINTTVEQSLTTSKEQLANVLDDMHRSASIQAEIQSEIDNIDSASEYCDTIISNVQSALQVA